MGRNGNAFFPPDVPLLTGALARSGYHCGLSGKLHLAAAQNRVEARSDDGYADFFYSHAPFQNWKQGNQYLDGLEARGVDPRAVFRVTPRGELGGYRPEFDTPELHQTTWCADHALDFLEARRRDEAPWLFSVNWFDPHVPFDAPRSSFEKYNAGPLPVPLFRPSDLETQRRLETAGVYFQTTPEAPGEPQRRNIAHYYGMISLIDEQVGRLLDALEQSGQRENTVVVFMSDHGEMLGDHGLTAKGCRFYEGLVRVPLIVSWPGRFRENVVCDDLVELLDLTPTLAQIGDVAMKGLQGRSLLPILTGQGEAAPRPAVRCEYYDACVVGFPEPAPPTFGTLLRETRWKISVYHGHDTGELYDLENDPGEFENLWDAPAAQREKLRLLEKSFSLTVTHCDMGPPLVAHF